MSAPLRSVFIGIPSLLARESLRAVTRHSKLVGLAESRILNPTTPTAPLRKYHSVFTNIAIRRNISFHLIGNGESLGGWLERLRPDILCVTGMARPLKPAEFQIPRLGSINLHPSLLPKYRGGDPFYWQYHQCDLDCAVTIHQIARGADDGDILMQKPFKIALGDSLETTIEQAASIGATAMAETLQQLSAGESKPKSQQDLVCPLYARIVPPGEHPADWLNWPLDRFWHFLRGTHGTHPFLTMPFGAAHHWRIGERTESGKGGAGTVEKDSDGYFLSHPAGRIELLPPLPWTVRRKIGVRLAAIGNVWRWRI